MGINRPSLRAKSKESAREGRRVFMWMFTRITLDAAVFGMVFVAITWFLPAMTIFVLESADSARDTETIIQGLALIAFAGVVIGILYGLWASSIVGVSLAVAISQHEWPLSEKATKNVRWTGESTTVIAVALLGLLFNSVVPSGAPIYVRLVLVASLTGIAYWRIRHRLYGFLRQLTGKKKPSLA